MVLNSGLYGGVKSVLSGLLAVGVPELFMIIAAGVLGKEGFNYLKQILLKVLKQYDPPDEVSRIRYNIGLILFIIPLLIALLMPYLVDHVTIILENYILISIADDGLLVLSLFVLDGNFWDKLRGLFIRTAKIQFS